MGAAVGGAGRRHTGERRRRRSITAAFHGADVAVVGRLVRVQVGRGVVGVAVALVLLAGVERLVGRGGAGGDGGAAAGAVRALEHPAGRVGAAVAVHRAANTLAAAVAVLVGAAGGGVGLRRMRRRAAGTDVLGARITVDGQIGVVVDLHGVALAVALGVLAVARRLRGQRQHRPGGGVGDLAGPLRGAGVRAAFVAGAAVGGHVALTAAPRSVAGPAVAAGGARRQGRGRRPPLRANRRGCGGAG